MNLNDATTPLKKFQSFAEGLKLDYLNAEMQDFAPGILKVQNKPPSPLPRIVLYGLECVHLVVRRSDAASIGCSSGKESAVGYRARRRPWELSSGIGEV